jgi:uncharacterized membrane protein
VDLQQQLKKASRIVQGSIYIFASFFHFVTEKEMALIPPFLPWRRAALYITGICEFAGGFGLLLPRFQRTASWGLAALLVAIWPANIYHAFVDKRSERWEKMRIYHFLRFPLQIVLILWVLWAAHEKSESLN